MESGIRRQLGTEANRRYLRELPIFRPDFKLPPKFGELLDEIDKATTQQHTDRRD